MPWSCCVWSRNDGKEKQRANELKLPSLSLTNFGAPRAQPEMCSELTNGGKADSMAGWVLLGFLWIAFLIDNIDRQAVFSIFPILSHQLHFSRVQLGLVGSIFLWTYCASNPLLGRLADVIQRERLVIWSIILWSVATLGTALSFSVHSFLIWRAALGL